MTQIFRVCADCGLEARTEEALENFKKSKGSKHDRDNICKPCWNKRKRLARTDDRYYLRDKLRAMKNRCYNPKDPAFSRYGGRGITICPDWLNNPEGFIDWALANGFQRDLQIDRIDNNGPYAPNNCRWATPHQQAMNTRFNVTDLKKGTRICQRCGIEKPLKEFYQDRASPAGRKYVCKSCDNSRRNRD